MLDAGIAGTSPGAAEGPTLPRFLRVGQATPTWPVGQTSARIELLALGAEFLHPSSCVPRTPIEAKTQDYYEVRCHLKVIAIDCEQATHPLTVV
jgi:hypothetical protein